MTIEKDLDGFTPSAIDEHEFDSLYNEAVRRESSVDDGDVVWKPQNGSQTAFLSCPLFEVLYHGTRGPGKSDALIMDFAQFIGRGFGEAWRGILFRQTYPQLADIVAKSHKWFRRIFPDARFNWSRMCWIWPSGEVLAFRHMARPQDYWSYHGHEYPWMGWEELTAWPDDRCYTSMMSCCRSSNPNMPRRVRANSNPYGVGTHWVKDRFKLAGQWWKTVIQEKPVDAEGEEQPSRAAIHGHYTENKVLLKADPNYPKTIVAAATSEAMKEAWLDGSWDIVAGGMFEDVWDPRYNIVQPFEIPSSWRLDRSFDWGSTHPFSVGWWAESDGTDYVLNNSGRSVPTVRGDIFRFHEWYGWNGHPNQGLKMLAVDVARGIIERQLAHMPGRVILPGPADSQIYAVENGMDISRDMAQPITIDGKVYPGIKWVPADKRPGSRKIGWEMMRKMLRAAHPNPDRTPRENPGLFVFDCCEQTIRTVPSAPRKETDLDDLDTDSEDHVADEIRYRVRFSGRYLPMAGGVGPAGLGPRLIEGAN
jgi:hypothetical protein